LKDEFYFGVELSMLHFAPAMARYFFKQLSCNYSTFVGIISTQVVMNFKAVGRSHVSLSHKDCATVLVEA
jgi:hypothetical protein